MTDDIRTIAVIGATGGVGRHVVRHALDAGYAVRAFARTPDNLDITHKALTRIQGNARSSVDLREAVHGADLVLSCLGNTRDQDRPIVEVGTYNLLDAMHREDVERVAIISSIGVRESGPQLFRLGPAGYAFAAIFATLLRQTKRDLTAAEDLVRASDRTHIIVRPSGLTDAPGTGRWKAADAQEAVGPQIPREDVAAFMVSLATDHSFDHQAVSIGGT